jgi:hypothetical protein
MASDESTPKIGVGQIIVKKIYTISFCCALTIMLLNQEVEANADHGKPRFMHMPLRLRNPRGAGISHQGARVPNLPESCNLPESHNLSVTEESEAEPKDHVNLLGDSGTSPSFAQLPQHRFDPRGAGVSRPMDKDSANAEFVSTNQMESASPHVNQVRFSHLPRLHNPRGVNVVKQIRAAQEAVNNEKVNLPANDEGDRS